MTLCFFHAIPVAGPLQLTAGIATHLVSKYPAKRQEQDAAQPHGMASRRTRCTEAKASLSSGTGLEVTKSCHRCWQPAGCASRVGGPLHALPQAFQAGLAEQSTELQGAFRYSSVSRCYRNSQTSLWPLHRKGFFFFCYLLPC